MIARRNDLQGQKFGRLTVFRLQRSSRHGMIWGCICACGAYVEVRADKLLSGDARSCGGVGCRRHGPLPLRERF